MSNTYTVKSNKETLATIAKDHKIAIDKLLRLNPKLKKDIELKIGERIKLDWITYQLNRPMVIAIATDTYLKPKIPFPDPANLPGVAAPKYGQDITKGTGRSAPKGMSVGKTPADLKPKMRKLLQVFASKDKSGMSTRLFDAFLKKKSSAAYFDDNALNMAASKHPNINDFCSFAMSAPNSPKKAIGKIRIHQALKNANWDITKITIPKDLGVPAFNVGSKTFQTGDFENGLGLMINGIQHAYVVATKYDYDEGRQTYLIDLRFIFYDVFGLDDEDLVEFGASSDSMLSSTAAIGITAWWQLQHQHGYSPLVTRIIIEKKYEVPAK